MCARRFVRCARCCHWKFTLRSTRRWTKLRATSLKVHAASRLRRCTCWSSLGAARSLELDDMSLLIAYRVYRRIGAMGVLSRPPSRPAAAGFGFVVAFMLIRVLLRRYLCILRRCRATSRVSGIGQVLILIEPAKCLLNTGCVRAILAKAHTQGGRISPAPGPSAFGLRRGSARQSCNRHCIRSSLRLLQLRWSPTPTRSRRTRCASTRRLQHPRTPSTLTMM